MHPATSLSTFNTVFLLEDIRFAASNAHQGPGCTTDEYLTKARMATLLMLIPDLFFSVRVADMVRALGHTPREVPDAAALLIAAHEDAAAIVIDTQARTDWQAAVHTLKANPATAAIPILAFGPHVDVAASRAAVGAGCDRIVTRGKFSSELPHLLQALLPNV
jgi:CheY-like chemotaxis protein